jgi:predicted SprT family Zn-dependent metalloprotease
MTDEEALERLRAHYHVANAAKFGGLLPDDYRIAWNPLLRRLTGRITYRERLIEVSTYHYRSYGLADALSTLEHEMLHLYLHQLRVPSGHNARFKGEAARRGIRVFHTNVYPRNQAPRDRYVYLCPACSRMVFRQRRHEGRRLACGVCCRALAEGAWDARFALELVQKVRMA